MSDDPITAEAGEAFQEPRSRLEQIKARRAKVVANLTHFIDVPTWEGNIVAEYRVLGEDDQKELRQARRESDMDGMLAAICKACVGLYEIADDGVTRLALRDRPDGPPARYDGTLKRLLGIDGDNDREICAYAFGGDNPTAVQNHITELGEWMADPTLPPSSSSTA